MEEPTAIGTLVILVFTGVWTFQGFRNPSFLERFIFNPAAILYHKEYHRLLTSGFLHANWVHFGFNAFSLYSFGRSIELIFGIPTLCLIYFGSIVGGSLLSLYLHRHHEYRALGASGGVCGVIFAAIFLVPGTQVMIFPLPLPVPAWLYAIVFIVGSFFLMRRQVGNIGHDAHLGGAIIGLLITTALHPSIVRQSPILYGVVMSLAAGLFAYLWFNPLSQPGRGPSVAWREFVTSIRGRLTSVRHQSEAQELDHLLDKVSRAGINSLTPRERKRLDALAQRRRAEHGPGY